MEREFTEAQREAIGSPAQDICVSAGAGSGKTGVLVARFMRIITESRAGTLSQNERACISEILVITFTDLATREMKSRIVEALNERGFLEERRELETAYISTIHGLCSRLLKENPFEAGVDPGFKVLDEAASRRMIRIAFDEALADGYLTHDTDITELVAETINDPTFTGSDLDGPAFLASEVEEIMRKLRGAGVTLSELRQLCNSGQLPQVGAVPVLTLLHPAFSEIAACVEDLKRISGGLRGIANMALASVFEALGKMQPGPDPVTRIENVRKMSAAIGEARRVFGSEPPPERLAALFNRFTAACEPVSALYSVTHESEAASKSKCRRLMVLICSIWAAYAEAKHEFGLLDNNDLVAECVRLMRESPHVRHRSQKQFRHIMVDEFQDTDLLQMHLVDMLHGSNIANTRIHLSTNSDTDVSHNNLFVVGDVQQSIYGFRNSDPQIFRNVERTFREHSAGQHIQLDENFRSRPEILQLVRQVFEIAWRGEATPFVPLLSSAKFDAAALPQINVLVSMNLARREYVHAEADAIARHIKATVDDAAHHVVITSHSSVRRGMNAGYGDIAVLLRALTDVRIYEEAFARHGVPALITAGGRGYYARHEIQDLLNVLALLDSPFDDVALLAVLRSPFVGVNVDTIYRLGMLARDGSAKPASGCGVRPIYTALPTLLESSELPAAEREKIEPFLKALDELRSDIDRVPIAQLIDRLIVQTNYDMRLVCRADGRRKLANVRKLVQIAFAEPDLTVREFVGRMRDITVLSDREGDAATAEEGSGTVRIMTMHAAKGLEFPIVILADLSRGLLSPETGQFLCDPASRAIGARTNGEPDATYRAIVQRKQETDKSELLRLLYVAMTRAGEHLVLCGNVGRNRGFNWADVVFPALGISSVPAKAQHVVLNGGVEAMVYPLTSLSSADSEDIGNRYTGVDSSGQRIDQLVERLLSIQPASSGD